MSVEPNNQAVYRTAESVSRNIRTRFATKSATLFWTRILPKTRKPEWRLKLAAAMARCS